MKRKICFAMVILGIAAMLTGVWLKAKEKPVILEFGMFTGSNWGVEDASSYIIIDRAIAAFEAEHPNVKIHYTSGIMKEDYSEWCAEKLMEGKMPDVFMVLNEDFSQFVSLGVVKNLDSLIEEDSSFNQEEFFAAALDNGKDNGHQYALPYEVVPSLLFVNKTLLAKEHIEVPEKDWKWNDMYEICRRITKDTNGDGIIDQFGTYNYSWLEAACTNGAEVFNHRENSFDFSNKNLIEAIKYIRKLNSLNEGRKVTQEDFNSGQVAFMPLTFAEYRTYKTYPYRIKKYTGFQWDCISFPKGPEGENISQIDSLLLGMNSRTKHKGLAWEFLKQLTCCREMQMDIFRYSQGVSVLKSVADSEEAGEIVQREMDEGEQVISSSLLCDVIEHGTTVPKYQKYEQIISLANMEVLEILQENKDIENSMKIFQRSIKEYLKQ